MNTIYRIVFNRTTGTWVVASELAKGRTKKSANKLLSVMALVAAVGGVGMMHGANAQGVVIGPGAVQGNTNNTVIGENAQGPGACVTAPYLPGVACSTVIGTNASASAAASAVLGDNASVTGVAGTAVGSWATAAQYSQAIGAGASASGGWATAIGQGASASSTNTVAIGTNSTATVDGAVALGSSAHATANNSFALGRNTNANTAGSMAFGYGVTSTGTNAIALGTGSSTNGNTSIAIGSSAATTATDAIALGDTANASAQGAIALGASAIASGTNATAMGLGASASAQSTVALGNAASASTINGTALGANSSAVGTKGATAVGWNASANSGSTSGAWSATTVGTNSIALGDGATAFGDSAHAQGDRAAAFGRAANATATQATAFGANTTANAAGSTAIGYNAQATAANATAIGANSTTNRANTVSVGSGGGERNIINVAAGVANTDAVNVSQLLPAVAALGGGASMDPTTGVVTGPTYNVQGGTQTNVGDALDALDGGLTTAQGNITTINSQIGGINSTLADAVMYDDSTHSSVTLGGTSATAPVALHNVAAGVADTDAVNMSQLNATNAQVATNTGDISNLSTSIANGTIGLVQQAAPGANLTVGKDTDGTAVDFADMSGNTRTLSNVSAGTAGTDAVNVSQLKGALADSGLTDGSGNALAAVTYDQNPDGTPNYGSVTMGGPISTDGGVTGGTKITNVAQGDLSPTSTDAVNGAQLYATNQQVAQNTGDITNLTNNLNNGTIGLVQQAGPGANLTVGKDTDGTAVDFADKDGNTRTLSNVSAGTAGTDAVNVSQLRGALADSGLTDGSGNALAAVTYDQNPDGTPNYGSVTMGGPISTDGGVTGGTKITNVAQGDLSPTSTDAVNGAQLYATNQQVAQNTSDISDLQGTMADAVLYDSSAHDSVTLGGASATSPVGLHNVAAGTAGTDAVNVSQLQGVTNALGGGASINPTTGAIVAPSYTVQGNTYNNVGDAIGGIDGDLTNLYSAVSSGGIGLVQQAAPGANLTVGKDTDGTAVDFADKDGNTRTLSNVSAGTADTDAVNVSQLKSSGLIDASGNAMAAVTYDQNADGTPNYNSITLGGGKSDGPVALHNVAAGTEDTDAVNVGQLKAAGLVDSDGNTLDAVVYDPGSNRGSVTLGGLGATAPVTLTNVANGVNQYDAVNFGQLSGVQSNLQNQINNMGNQVTSIDGRVTNLENAGTPPVGDDPVIPPAPSADYVAASAGSEPATPATVGSSTGSVAIGYNSGATGDGASAVGQGATASGSNSTATGSNAAASGNNATAVGAGATASGSNSVALGAGSVATQANSVSVGSAGNERTITNVAAGVNATDAVNVSQLQASQNWAQGYMDQKATQLNNRITSMGRHADAGTAGAMAMSNIPQAYQPNQSSLGAGIGTFNGQAAIAVGMSTITPSGRWVLKGSLTGNSQGDVGVGFGASMVW